MGYRNYHYIDERKTWKDAQSYCREHHSDLATISNMEDNNIALKSKTNSTENFVWIGLNYNNPQGAWRWSDSSNASFCNWNRGEPERRHITSYILCRTEKGMEAGMTGSVTTSGPFICYGEL